MTAELPEYYFRIRENGAAVFKIDAANRNRRLELDEIAMVNTRNGTIKPHGDRSLSADDQAAIESWLTKRKSVTEARELDDVWRSIDQLNLTAHWAQARATPSQLDAVTDGLLMAMHDLRAVLVRKKADRLQADARTAEERP